MPKFYCDYCDSFLTHDSPSVRKTHNGGRKHKENVRMFYQNWMEKQAQKLVDATTRAFTQNRLLMQGGQPPLPMGGPMVPMPMGAPMAAQMGGRPMLPHPGMRMPMPFPYPMPGMARPGFQMTPQAAALALAAQNMPRPQ